MLDRQTIIRAFDTQLRNEPVILAAWLGGSDATGRVHELSDVDLGLVVEPGCIEEAAAAVERVLTSLSPISVKWRLAMPTWHGFPQAFYQLADAPEEIMVDWVILERGQPHPWLERERHGRPKVLFDPHGLVQEASVDREAIRAQIDKKMAELEKRWRLFRHLPAKLARRSLPVDSAAFYQTTVLRPVVDALRAVHCPDRWDYGFRYVKDDLPREKYEALCQLAYPRDAGEIASFTKRAGELIEEAIGAWKRGRGEEPRP